MDQRNLPGYNPWGHKNSDMTECNTTHTHLHTNTHILSFNPWCHPLQKGKQKVENNCFNGFLFNNKNKKYIKCLIHKGVHEKLNFL